MVDFKVYKSLDLVHVAKEVSSYWEQMDIFKKSIAHRDEKNPFVFFEGPPSANGLPGIHHVLGRAVKDLFARYKTMQGFQVKRKAGWDTHGLPIELGVEKALGITKEDIGHKITVAAYNEACKEAVMRYTDIWNDLTAKMGYWVDMDNPYVTYKPKYMESVWWLLSRLHQKGMLYKGYTIQPYSPKAGTGLSSHEVNQPGAYQDVTDTTVIAQFKAVPESVHEAFRDYADNLYFLAWTTTPWTLPSNTALTVGAAIDYLFIKTFNRYTKLPIIVVVAEQLLDKCFEPHYKKVNGLDFPKALDGDEVKIPYMALEKITGGDLVGIRYEQLLPFVQPHQNPENAFRIIEGDFVTTEEGTGIVHTAPTFGADDAVAAKHANPPVPPMLVMDENKQLIPLVDLQGKFTEHVGPYAGKYVKNEYYKEGTAPDKSVDIEIAIQLKKENKAFHVAKYHHSYPHCWRTDKPILYYPLDSWFINVSKHKEALVQQHENINWQPKSTGEGRFGNWLKNANDWNLSRSRYWGIPLPIWRDKRGRHEICIGSIAQLKKEMKKSVEAGLMDRDIFEDFNPTDCSDENYDKVDLHKNIVDQIVLVAPDGQPMYRESDLIDVWFDSGAMPYAQWHYPFENKALIDAHGFYPADFIAEGVDQTRGWFYTLHVISTLVFGSVAYKNVISNGLVLDKYGKKMSKRVGNSIDPFKTLATYGPDATRWYMMGNTNPWDNLRFDLEGITEVTRKFFGTLYNTYAFFALYANLDGFDASKEMIPISNRSELDRWVLSELHTLIKNVTHHYDAYEPTKVVRAVQHFVTEHLSNWFVRLSRRRFWKTDASEDKKMAQQTLYTCLLAVSKIAAPIAPFYMDQLYRDLTGLESVHLADFPKHDEACIDEVLERRMQKAQLVASMVLSLRKKKKIRVRQPLKAIMIPVMEPWQRADLEVVSPLICKEVNVKSLEIIEDAAVLVKKIQPNFRVLGPRFGKRMKTIASRISSFTQDEINLLDVEGSIALSIEDESIKIEKSEVLIDFKDIEGWVVAGQAGMTVALDVSIDEDLKKEGMVRELINRVQNIRKEMDLEVTDHICLTLSNHTALANAMEAHRQHFQNETLTREINFVDDLEHGVAIEFDAIKIKAMIKKSTIVMDKKYYSEADLKEFKEVILAKIEEAEKQLDYLKKSYRNGQGNKIDDTAPVFKSSAEHGAVDLEKEANARLAIRQEKFIRDLNNALIRIENGTYGICRETGQRIAKERLLLVPHTTLSIDAKKKQ